jgi:hypothetical protein
VRKPVLDPVVVAPPEPPPEPINVAPVAAAPVAATPVPPVPPTPVANDATFAAGAASVRASTVGVPVNNAAALPGAGAMRGVPAMAKAAVPGLP